MHLKRMCVLLLLGEQLHESNFVSCVSTVFIRVLSYWERGVGISRYTCVAWFSLWFYPLCFVLLKLCCQGHTHLGLYVLLGT